MIAARLPGGACELNIIRCGDDTQGRIYSRPDIRRVHQLLQITEDELRRRAGAKMVMALPVKLSSAEGFDMPLGDYGRPRRGCDFQHYWQRASAAGRAEDMSHYNFALRLHQAGYALADTTKDMPQIDPAYQFDGAKYADLLMSYARRAAPIKFHEGQDVTIKINGDTGLRHVLLSGQALKSDLIIDMRREDLAPYKWAFNYLPVRMQDELPGLVLFQVKSALERLFSLWPDRGYNPSERAEYDRLTAAAQAHIDDMMSLLSRGVSAQDGPHDGPQDNPRDGNGRLRRKIDLFQSRGRLAFEDYDVFTKAEWITALRAAGANQAGYDRLADRESLDDILSWLDGISQNIDAHIAALKGKNNEG